MNKQEFIENLKQLNISFTEEMLEKLEIYKEFLKEYNRHTNLTAIKEDNEIYLKHFYDSLTVVKSIDLDKINNLLDIGTGAGFPGMVIKIFFPKIDVTLLDSNNKKISFLNELSKKLNLKVNLVNTRVEEYAKTHLNSFDVVISRAVANLRILSELSLPLVKKENFFVALKGNIEEELNEAQETIELMHGVIVKKFEFKLYNNEGIRNIIVIKKNSDTQIEELRKYDKILQKPLKKSHK